MRKNFAPSSFERNQELMRELIKEEKEFIKGIYEFIS